MRPSELQYTRDKGLFYSNPDTIGVMESGHEDYFVGLPSDNEWRISYENVWAYVNHASFFPEQGWKIHVSAIPNNAQEILDVVAEVCIKQQVSFKFLRDESVLRASLEKYGDRAQNGKFIAIYPHDEEEFSVLVELLTAKLEKYEGPDVLTDARVGTAPVHVRYGGFRLVFTENELGEQVPAIRDNNGEYVEDFRAPFFHCPDWVNVPSVIKSAVMTRLSTHQTHNPFEPYVILDALHFSNAGGVYTGSWGEDDEPIVIFKEARPYVGLDENGKWAKDRLAHEARVLQDLQDVEGVVNFVRMYQYSGHDFLVEEFFPGVSLNTWIAQNYPFSDFADSQEYGRRAVNIMRNVRNVIRDAHSHGWAIMDVQPMNILINDEDEVCFIDMEAAVRCDDSSPRGIGTPGFVPLEAASPEENDWFAYNRILAHVMYPLVPLNSVSDYLIEEQLKRAEDVFEGGVLQNFRSLLHEEKEEIRRPYPIPLSRKESVLSFVEMLRKGVCETVYRDDTGMCLPGDILQFEHGGHVNISTGIASLCQCGDNVLDEVVGRLEEFCVGDTIVRGYMDGIDGAILACGATEKYDVWTDLSPWKKDESSLDISIRSGLAGVLLTHIVGAQNGYLDVVYVRETADLLASIIDDDTRAIHSRCTSSEEAAGLIDGYCGAGVALGVAAEFLNEDFYLDRAVSAVRKDYSRLYRASDGSLQIPDGSRLMPYFAEGSAGILFAFSLAPNIFRGMKKEIDVEGLLRATQVRCSANGGLFMGRAGLIAAQVSASRLIPDSFASLPLPEIEKILQTYCFSVEEYDGCLLGGQGGLRLSADYSTGNLGVLRVLEYVCDEQKTPWTLFPYLESLSSIMNC